MSDLVTEYTTYDAFARHWRADTPAEREPGQDADEQCALDDPETRHLWLLLGLLDADELVIQLPEWLADEKVGYTDGATPTLFVGRITRETEKAILFEESAAARPLCRLAHRIHKLEEGIDNVGDDVDRRAWLESRVQKRRREFAEREDITGLTDAWLPKSRLERVIRRR